MSPRFTIDRLIVTFCVILLGAMVVAGCSTPPQELPLRDYYNYGSSPRHNLPEDYVAFLKESRFRNGELDNLPPLGIILYADVAETLRRLGYGASQITTLKIGTATPATLSVVRTPKHSFMVMPGMPGAGGVATSAAELAALGAKMLVHIGTCARIGIKPADSEIFVARGSVKDGAAVLLSVGRETNQVIARPDERLTQRLHAILPEASYGLGFTSPIYYFEPTDLYRTLALGLKPYPACDYVEMEQAPFFVTCWLRSVPAASIVVSGDQYVFDSNGVKHDFFDHAKVQAGLERAVSAAITLAQ